MHVHSHAVHPRMRFASTLTFWSNIFDVMRVVGVWNGLSITWEEHVRKMQQQVEPPKLYSCLHLMLCYGSCKQNVQQGLPPVTLHLAGCGTMVQPAVRHCSMTVSSDISSSPQPSPVALTLRYSSCTSVKKLRIASSFLPSCSSRKRLFPGVT